VDPNAAGHLPLKRFFCGGTTSAAGEEVAWDAVRLKLQEIVDGEDKQHPLSDDQLVAKLAEAGITVARRTVTKYRKRWAFSVRASAATGAGEEGRLVRWCVRRVNSRPVDFSIGVWYYNTTQPP